MARDPVTGLTPKQLKFTREYLRTGTGTQAALASYDTDSETARSIAYENLTKPHVRRNIDSILAAEQLHPKRIAAKLNQLIDHERTLISPTGEVVGKEPDPATQLKAIDITAKLLALYPGSDGQGRFSQHLHQHVHLEAESSELVSWIAKHRRLPTEEERRQILAPDPQDVVVETKDNNCD